MGRGEVIYRGGEKVTSKGEFGADGIGRGDGGEVGGCVDEVLYNRWKHCFYGRAVCKKIGVSINK